MNDQERQRRISDALSSFAGHHIRQPSLELLSCLGYESQKTFSNLEITPENISKIFGAEYQLDGDRALIQEWNHIEFLFQLTEEEIALDPNGMDDDNRLGVDPSIYRSYLLLAIDLLGDSYTRTQLSSITREINRLFKMPAMILFRHDDTLTFSIIDRRPSKLDQEKDVLEKVTLIKDISFQDPHRGHLEILTDLSLLSISERFDVSDFLELHEAWQTVLDSSELNRRFYQEIANWYYWAVDNVVFPAGAGEDEGERNATSVIRLITRIIFIWFLKEQGLVPEDFFLEHQVEDLLRDFNPKKSTYYKAILQNLFFATLNQEMNTPDNPDNRRFRGKRARGRDQHYLIHNVYRYEDHFRDPDKFLTLTKEVPFLNGGLFECLDRRDPDDPSTIIRIDGFSDRPDNSVSVPNFLFFSDVKSIDLNDVFFTKGRDYTVRGLLKILSRYKFTIEENTPIEEEVALDPELLGKVFENLLAAFNPETGVTARKQTGSFYTPREIVNYMVDEVLNAHLASALIDFYETGAILSRDISTGQPDLWGSIEPIQEKLTITQRELTDDEKQDIYNRVRNLLAYNDDPPEFDSLETDVLIRTIDATKILDPACGSGAFPVGILQKIVFILGKLDPGNARWKRYQLGKVEDAIKAVEQMDSPISRGPLVVELQAQLEAARESFDRKELDYSRKLFVIENCIYGVDIQPIAVQIAKLRCFVSLIVDQQIDDQSANRGIIPLPNLETKFVAANSLISLHRPGGSSSAPISFGDHSITDLREELSRVRHRMFSARTPKTKRILREEDARLRERITKSLSQSGWDANIARRLASWDPYDSNSSAGFFDPEWMFGVDDGFEIVIGNPPYMRVQGIQQTQGEFMPYYREQYEAAVGNFDLYALFIERGYKLLSENGQFAYIVPHKFFQASFGEGLRGFLADCGALRQVVRFGSVQVFEESTTYTCLLFLSAQPNMHFDMIEVRALDRGKDVLRAVRNRSHHPDYDIQELEMPSRTLGAAAERWNFVIGEEGGVLRRIQKHELTLGDITRKIFVGLQTSADRIYVLELREERDQTLVCYSRSLRKEVEIEKGLVKPFLLGKDVHRYEPPHSPNVVIFPYSLSDEQAKLMSQEEIQIGYPLGWKYLKANRRALEGRENDRMAGEGFYAYIYPKNLVEFESTKIITPEIALGCQMTLDAEGRYYHTTKVYGFAFNRKAHPSIRFYLGLLNSKVLWFFLSNTGYVLRGGYYTFKTKYLNPFPIAESTKDQRRLIEILVRYVLHLKARAEISDSEIASDMRIMTSYFELLIDSLIYEMYFPEEFTNWLKKPSRLLIRESLPDLSGVNETQPYVLHGVFNRLYQPDHPIRKMLFSLDSIETFRVIEAKSKLP